MKKKIIFFFIFFFLLIFYLVINFSFKNNGLISRSIIPQFYPQWIYLNFEMLFDYKKNSKKILNDYNIKFLPNTQFVDIDFKKIKLDFLWNDIKSREYWKLRKTFFIEIYKEKIFILDFNGNIYSINTNELQKKNFSYKKIFESNYLDKSNTLQNILDFKVFKDQIYLSKVVKENNCNYLEIDLAEINFDRLNFKNIFSTKSNDECIEGKIQGGKIEIDYLNNLYITTSADIDFSTDKPDKKSQDGNSLFGKVLSINLENYSYEIFNKGHRVSLGLVIDQNFLISTENGPRGGDEVNLEIKHKNYGWDLASYGSKYSKNELYPDHESNKYQEPIFSFVPSIGISEIIKLDDNFSDKWKDNFLIGSLNDRHLLRVKFNKKRSKVLFVEKIFIGERIRDLAYDNSTKSVLLALEETGSIGIFRNILNN